MRSRKKKKRRGRGRRALSTNESHNLRMIRGDIEMLDRILKSGYMRSEFQDEWIKGCREGMAIAHDLVAGRIQDIQIRGMFQDKPIRLRYNEGADRMVSDGRVVIHGAMDQATSEPETEEDDRE